MAGPLRITYPADLPVSQRRDDIAAAIRDHQVVIVAGETGSGKTTQLPKICLELGRGQQGLIGHTQPRRIAARSVAERIASELGTELGDLVGYQVRFTDRTSRASRVKLMTDGILLAELQRDRQLRKYDTIIIDEAHERSLNIDFLLGYLKRLLPKRPDLKLIITSATIDPERFAQHFADRRGRPAPIIEVSGRTYPVDVRYRPLVEVPENDDEGEAVVRDQTEAIVAATKELMAEGAGDILVFLPGEREIRDTADALGELGATYGRGGGGIDVVPLYSRLSAAEQHKVFQPHGGRRIVLATNVAETSLTVPGIRYVVDTGVARISRYSVRTKVQRLPIEAISQASANQRSGRCGRVAAGIAIRLYSEEDFEARPEFTDPEILRTNLASVILQMASLGLGDLARFPFVEPPDKRNVQAGSPAARGARRHQRRPADQGGAAAGAPADRPAVGPDGAGGRTARLRARGRRDRRRPVAAGSPRAPGRAAGAGRPAARALQVRELGLPDLAGPLALPAPAAAGPVQQCVPPDVQAGVPQLPARPRVAGLREPAAPGLQGDGRAGRVGPADQPDADGIHQALLSGLLSHVGALEEREKARPGERRPMREYLGARGARFAIFPGSGLARKNPAYLMAGELVETSRLWARQNAAIKPEWAEQLGAHLVKRTYSEPHWSKKRAAVMAYERVTLYGVPLVADRLVQYGTIDRAVARELFIRHALVQGEWAELTSGRHRFYTENQALLAEAEELEHRARRRDIVVDEHTLFDFYDARVGEDVVSGAHFATWWKRERQAQPTLLDVRPRDAHAATRPTRCGRTTSRATGAATPTGDGAGIVRAALRHPLPLRAGRRRRRHHHRRARRDAQPRRGRRLLVERARACARSSSPA